jgi:hypothetical protein
MGKFKVRYKYSERSSVLVTVITAKNMDDAEGKAKSVFPIVVEVGEIND